MTTKGARLFLGTITAALALSLVPAHASTPQMVCAPGFEAVCAVIGTSCKTIEAAGMKVLKKDLWDCQLG